MFGIGSCCCQDKSESGQFVNDVSRVSDGAVSVYARSTSVVHSYPAMSHHDGDAEFQAEEEGPPQTQIRHVEATQEPWLTQEPLPPQTQTRHVEATQEPWPRQERGTRPQLVKNGSMRLQQREKEKQRLQRMVNDFVKSAVPGQPCTFLDAAEDTRTASIYRVTKNLLSFYVVEAEGTKVKFKCQIAEIQDVYSFSADGSASFDPVVVEMASEQDRELLLLVVCMDGSRLYMLETSPEQRDTLLECLRILCVYAQQTKDATKG